MKANLLNMLRGEWALHPGWVDANIQLVNRVLRGEAVGADVEEADRNPQAVLMYSPMYRVSPFTDVSELPKGSTAFVNVVGVITKYGGLCSYGAKEYADMTDRLSAAENISNIIYHFDSPGGQVYGTQLFADAIKRSTKRTIAFISDGYCASAAIWVASACGEVYCSHNTDEVGSIGVYTILQDINAYFASEGLPVYEIYAPQSKQKNLDVREAFAGKPALVQAHLRVLADAFINTIKTNRAGKLKSDDWQEGGMFFAPDALKIGLIDGIKSLADITAMLEADAEAEEVPDDEEDEADPNTIVVVEDEDEDDEDDDDQPNAQITTPHNMFGKNKYPAITALSGRKPEDIGEEDITAANAELHASGIDADVVLASASSIQASETRITELEAEVKALGAQPGGHFTAPKVTKVQDAPQGGAAEDDTESVIANLPHNKAVASVMPHLG